MANYNKDNIDAFGGYTKYLCGTPLIDTTIFGNVGQNYQKYLNSTDGQNRFGDLYNMFGEATNTVDNSNGYFVDGQPLIGYKAGTLPTARHKLADGQTDLAIIRHAPGTDNDAIYVYAKDSGGRWTEKIKLDAAYFKALGEIDAAGNGRIPRRLGILIVGGGGGCGGASRFDPKKDNKDDGDYWVPGGGGGGGGLLWGVINLDDTCFEDQNAIPWQNSSTPFKDNEHRYWYVKVGNGGQGGSRGNGTPSYDSPCSGNDGKDGEDTKLYHAGNDGNRKTGSEKDTTFNANYCWFASAGGGAGGKKGIKNSAEGGAGGKNSWMGVCELRQMYFWPCGEIRGGAGCEVQQNTDMYAPALTANIVFIDEDPNPQVIKHDPHKAYITEDIDSGTMHSKVPGGSSYSFGCYTNEQYPECGNGGCSDYGNYGLPDPNYGAEGAFGPGGKGYWAIYY